MIESYSIYLRPTSGELWITNSIQLTASRSFGLIEWFILRIAVIHIEIMCKGAWTSSLMFICNFSNWITVVFEILFTNR